MRYCFLFIWIALLGCTSIKQIIDFESFSQQLRKEQRRQKCSFYPDLAYAARERFKEKLNFVDYRSDTVYILESFNPESGSLYQSIWTTRGRLEYKIQGSKVEIVSSPFLKRLYPMIEQWDVLGVKEEEKEYGQLLGGSQIIATRVILKNGKSEMKCFKFKEFFNLNKDQVEDNK